MRWRKESTLAQEPKQNWNTGQGAEIDWLVLQDRPRVANPSGWQGVAAHPGHRPNATWSITEPQGARGTTGQWQGPLCHAEGTGDTEGKHKLIALLSPTDPPIPVFLWSAHYFGLLN